MDLSSKGIANPVVYRQQLSNPRTKVQKKIKKILKNKYKQVSLTQNKIISSASTGTHELRDHLAPGAEPVPKETQNSHKETEVIHSTDINNPNHFEESDELMTSEGVTPVTQQIGKKVSFATTSRKPAIPSRNKTSKPKFVFDANKDTVRTHASQMISTRKHKRTTPFIHVSQYVL